MAYDIGNEEAAQDAAGEYEDLRRDSSAEVFEAYENACAEWNQALMAHGSTSPQAIQARAKVDAVLEVLIISGDFDA